NEEFGVINELRPGIRRLLPAGSGGAGCTGLGSRSDDCACETLERSDSRRPARPATTAVPAAAALVRRKRLRPGPYAGTGRTGRYAGDVPGRVAAGGPGSGVSGTAGGPGEEAGVAALK